MTVQSTDVDVEDEQHFILHCTALEHIRKQFLRIFPVFVRRSKTCQTFIRCNSFYAIKSMILMLLNDCHLNVSPVTILILSVCISKIYPI